MKSVVEPQTETAKEITVEQKIPISVFEDGLDNSAECLMKYVNRLNPSQQQMLLDQARKMITPQTESSIYADLPTTVKKSPESEPPNQS